MDPISRTTETRDTHSEGRPARRLITVLFGLLEVVFAFRLFFMLLGANSDNGFVKGLYSVSQPAISIFEGIFPKMTAPGMVFEPATLIVLLVVALVGLGILKLMGSGSRRLEKTQVTQPAPVQENVERSNS
jgi:hypothetical protein